MREPTKLFLAGLLTIAMGAFPLLASFDVIASDDDDFGAPRWLVASIGFTFVLVGAWLAVTRAPATPLTALLRVLGTPLLLSLCAAFCAAVVYWFRRVHAGPPTRAAFFVLAVLFALNAARTLWVVIPRRPSRPSG